MSVDIILNHTFDRIEYKSFYKSEIILNVEYPCSINYNSLLLYCSNPRTNIDSIIAFVEFYFPTKPDEQSVGEITAKAFINYYIFSINQNNFHFCPIKLKTKGQNITEICLTLPQSEKLYLRELVYSLYPKTTDECPICYENKPNIITIHYSHAFCFDCLMKIPPSCPVCREKIY